MKKIYIFIFLLLCAPTYAEQTAIMPEEYSMEMVFSAETGDKKTHRVFGSNGNIRTEMNLKGETVATVVRRDKNLLYQINLTKKEFTEIILPKNFQSLEDLRNRAKWRYMGTKKMMDGEEIEKYEGIADDNGKQVQMVYWINKNTRLPIRRSINGEVIDFFNFRAGTQDTKLFEIPEGFKKIEVAQNQSPYPQPNTKSTIQVPASQSRETINN